MFLIFQFDGQRMDSLQQRSLTNVAEFDSTFGGIGMIDTCDGVSSFGHPLAPPMLKCVFTAVTKVGKKNES